MSSRQTGYRYGLGGGGGIQTTPSGQYPWQRNAMLDRMLQMQQSQQEATSKLSAQEAEQEQKRIQLENQLKEHLLKSQQFLDMATKAGATGDEFEKYAGDVAKGAVANLLQQQSNVGEGLKSPDVQKATHDQLIAESQTADARNRAAMKTDVPMGGTGYLPPPLNTGMGTTVSGATPGGQILQQIQMGKDKQGNPILSPIPAQITQPYTPGGVKGPIQPPPGLLNQAAGITPGGPMATPGLTTGMPTNPNPISPPSNAQQGQQQYNSPIGPNRLNTGLIPSAARAAAEPFQQMYGADKELLNQLIQYLWTGNQQ